MVASVPDPLRLPQLRSSWERMLAAIDPAVARILDKSLEGKDISQEEAAILFDAEGPALNPLILAADELRRRTVGDVVTLQTQAAQTHPNEDWRGKKLTIELTIHEVDRRILPEIDEAFAVARGFDSLDEFREFVAERLKVRVQQEIQSSLRNQICQHLLEKTDLALPEGAVRRQTERVLRKQYLDLLQAGVTREKIDENLAHLQAAADQRAQSDLKLSFILGRIAEEEKIEVGDDEINARIAQIAQTYNRRPERLRQELAADGSLEQLGVAIRLQATGPGVHVTAGVMCEAEPPDGGHLDLAQDLGVRSSGNAN